MARPRWKRTTIAAVKAVVAVVVLWAVGRHVVRTWNDLAEHRLTLHFEPAWLVVAGLLYLAGLSAYGVFYERILRASATPIRLVPALRAYLVSHLGKYVPGKAMVVVMRSGMVVPFGARASTAAIATFYETLVMMAAGGMIAAAGFAMASGSGRVSVTVPGWGPLELPLYRLSALSGLGLGLAFVVVVSPPVFDRLAGLISLPIPGVGPDALPRLSGGLLERGLLWSSIGWILLGLSLLAVVRSMGPAGAGAGAARSRRRRRPAPGHRQGAGDDRRRGAGDGGRVRGGGPARRPGRARGRADRGPDPRPGPGPRGRGGVPAAAGLGDRRAGRRRGPDPDVPPTAPCAGRGRPDQASRTHN